MKDKHLQIRIEQCLTLSKASNCPRRKFGAMLLDPVRNVVLMDGYNGGPRGGGEQCGGQWCHREGFPADRVTIEKGYVQEHTFTSRYETVEATIVRLDGKDLKAFPKGIFEGWTLVPENDPRDVLNPFRLKTRQELAAEWIQDMAMRYPAIASGTHVEQGCHHAEMNVICNAAAAGVATDKAWMIVTGEPCLMCAKLIHHAGIAKVIVVDGGFSGPNGIDYLKGHQVEIQTVDGPKDPRVPA